MIMRRLKEILRLKLDCGLKHRQIQRAVGVSIGAVSKYCRLAEQARLSWPMLERLDDTEIERLLQPAAQAGVAALRIEPDYAQVHRELKRKGVTLTLLWEEYRGEHPGESTYRYTQFTQRYRDFAASLKRSMRQTHLAGEKLFADYAGHTLPIWEEKTGDIALPLRSLSRCWERRTTPSPAPPRARAWATGSGASAARSNTSAGSRRWWCPITRALLSGRPIATSRAPVERA